ncbi:MAG: SH3 domain-containing protein, partial [Eubacteriales bacterium]|nr:SH3 domain-containing protein [Eubacteriales bacterium]
MRNRKTERRGAGRLTVLIAALLVAVLAAVPAAAATVTASDVMIRNSGEERNDNIIGSLNEGDKVTVISQSTDKSGIEWYYIELPNGNRGYVKAQWIDNNGEEVETSQTPAAAQQTQEEEKQPEQQDSSGQGGEAESGQNWDAAEETPAGEDADEEGIDDWTEEDAEMLNAAPVTDGSGADGAAADAQEGGESIAEGQEAPAAEEENAYNPYTDPNAQYNISFITEKDGTGSWYVYNYDTDKRIRLSDLDKMSDAEQAARKSASSAGIWRMIACILMVLLAALLIFLYLALRNTGRPSPRAGRARRRRTPVYDEDEEDDGFVYAGSRDEEPEESMTEIPGSSAEEPDRTETEEPAGETAPQEESADSDTPAGETAGEAAELTGEEQEEDVPVRPKKAGGLFGMNRKKNRKSDSEEDEEEEYEDE